MFKDVDVRLDIYFFKDDNQIVAYSPALEMTGYGTSIKDAQNSFSTVFQLYLEEAYKNDTLIADLLDHGWTIQTNHVPIFTTLKIN